MANEEHLRILQQGVEAWNEWRSAHPDIKPDHEAGSSSRLEIRNLRERTSAERTLTLRTYGADLSGADLSGASLEVTYLSDATVQRDLRRADLVGTDLNLANRGHADLSRRRPQLCGSQQGEPQLGSSHRDDLSGAHLASRPHRRGPQRGEP